jgi:hypothetical protein
MLSQDRTNVRQAYADLKRDLRAESESLKLSPMNDAQMSFYDRPVRHAAAHLVAPTNARNSKVRESLSEAHSDIVLGITRLNQRRSSITDRT